MARVVKNVRFVAALLAVAATAFLGVLAGNWYLDHRHKHRLDRKVEGLATGTSSGLRAGEPFPSIALVDLQGRPTTTTELVAAKATLVIFVSIHCDACTEAVASWTANFSAIPRGVMVFGIADDGYEYVRVYADKAALPFPLFCDETDRFGKDYDMTVYPSVVGLDERGDMIFIRHGFGKDFTPRRALELLGIEERGGDE